MEWSPVCRSDGHPPRTEALERGDLLSKLLGDPSEPPEDRAQYAQYAQDEEDQEADQPMTTAFLSGLLLGVIVGLIPGGLLGRTYRDDG